MNFAERRRDLRIAAMRDSELLDMLRADDEVEPDEWVIICNMQKQLAGPSRVGSTFPFRDTAPALSLKQRAWAEEIARRITPISAKHVPEGRLVETPAVLQNLPKKPPRRIVT